MVPLRQTLSLAVHLTFFWYTTQIFINLDFSNISTALELHKAYDLIKEHWLLYITYITQNDNEYAFPVRKNGIFQTSWNMFF